jgi:serine/threonine-protein kinase
MTDAPVKAGDILAGKYRVDRVLGKGGMGFVVAATHIELRELRALKFMRPEALADAESVARFLREARAASRLKGEHVTRVFDVGRLEDGAPYMVMEYLEGSDLAALLKRSGALPSSDVALYLLHACEALAEAHASGIIHRDLKPGNLFLTHDLGGAPCIKVLDFGISKILDEAGVTRSHTLLGSPFYMSPEQMRSTRDVDARTDIWALGVIGYQLLAGRLPFHGRTVTEIITAVIQTPPEPLSRVAPAVPAGLEAVIARCLQKDVSRRYASIAELAAEIAPFAPSGGMQSAAISKRALEPRSVRPEMLSTTAVAAVTHPETGRILTGPVSSDSGARMFLVGMAAATVVGLALAVGLAIGVSRSRDLDGGGRAQAGDSPPPPARPVVAPVAQLEAAMAPDDGGSALKAPAASPSTSAPPAAPSSAPVIPPAVKKAARPTPVDPFGPDRK